MKAIRLKKVLKQAGDTFVFLSLFFFQYLKLKDQTRDQSILERLVLIYNSFLHVFANRDKRQMHWRPDQLVPYIILCGIWEVLSRFDGK